MFNLFRRSANTAPPVDDRTTCRDLIAREMHLRAETLDDKGRSVEAVIATENRARVYDLRRDEIIDEVLLLDGVDIPRQIPMLENHMRFGLETHLGSIRDIRVAENVRLANGKTVERALVGRLHFAEGAAMPAAERAWQLVRQGHLTDVSTGNQAIEAVLIEPHESATVNGRTYTATDRALQITQRWRPREGSLTSIGADADAQIRSARSPAASAAGNATVDGAALASLAADRANSVRTFAVIERELAAASGLEPQRIDALLNGGRSAVAADELAGLAAVLDVEPSDLTAS